jgi:hypothetical protein
MSDSSAVGLLAIAADADPAGWVVAGLRGHTYDVGSVVPATFEAYARVFHPATRGDGGSGAEVRWAEVAQANGRVMHPAAEWGSITGSWDYQYRKSQPGLWDDPPCTGKLPPAVAIRLAAVLADFTGAPGRCWFAVWEGWADLAHPWDSAPRFDIPGRRMLLLSGPVGAVAVSLAAQPWISRSANLWWPEDHAWCVGTDIDLMTTYVGASAQCVGRLVAEAALETLPISAEQRVTWDSDTINPQPPAPH